MHSLLMNSYLIMFFYIYRQPWLFFLHTVFSMDFQSWLIVLELSKVSLQLTIPNKNMNTSFSIGLAAEIDLNSGQNGWIYKEVYILSLGNCFSVHLFI